MKILIAGDSWGIGVFSYIGDTYGPTGQGIHTVLENWGHEIVNISCAGGSNGLMLDRLEGQWDRSDRCIFGVNTPNKVIFNLTEIDIIVFFQTDIFRERSYYDKQFIDSDRFDWKVLEKTFVEKLLNFASLEEFSNLYFQSLYTKLNSFGKKILCIGGWAKLHPSIALYSNLIPVIESATQHLIADCKQDSYITDREYFLQLSQHSEIMKKFGNEIKNMTIQNAEKLDLIIKNWQDVHPKFEGYTKIAECLKPYLEINSVNQKKFYEHANNQKYNFKIKF